MKIDWYRLLPWYWFQSYPTSWEWDALLNEILDKRTNVTVSNYTTTIDGVEIWTANYPYAYGSPRNTKKFLPSVKTRKRLKKFVERLKKLVESTERDISYIRSKWTNA